MVLGAYALFFAAQRVALAATSVLAYALPLLCHAGRNSNMMTVEIHSAHVRHRTNKSHMELVAHQEKANAPLESAKQGTRRDVRELFGQGAAHLKVAYGLDWPATPYELGPLDLLLARLAVIAFCDEDKIENWICGKHCNSVKVSGEGDDKEEEKKQLDVEATYLKPRYLIQGELITIRGYFAAFADHKVKIRSGISGEWADVPGPFAVLAFRGSRQIHLEPETWRATNMNCAFVKVSDMLRDFAGLHALAFDLPEHQDTLFKKEMRDFFASFPLQGLGRVHRGVVEAYRKFLSDGLLVTLQEGIQKLAKRKGLESVPLYITGHSWGAALATLAAFHLRVLVSLGWPEISKDIKATISEIYVEAFAGPRVGDKDFVLASRTIATHLGSEYDQLRWARYLDPVPHLAPTLGASVISSILPTNASFQSTLLVESLFVLIFDGHSPQIVQPGWVHTGRQVFASQPYSSPNFDDSSHDEYFMTEEREFLEVDKDELTATDFASLENPLNAQRHTHYLGIEFSGSKQESACVAPFFEDALAKVSSVASTRLQELSESLKTKLQEFKGCP